MAWFIGIDIGSATSKGVITEGGSVKAHHLIPSGTNYKISAQTLKQKLLDEAGISFKDVSYIVATGCGAGNVESANQEVSDIICCAKGIRATFPEARTVINIGTQSSEVIRLDENGRVVDFAVSEKCAAGSAWFLQVMANVLRIDLKDIGPLSLKSRNPITFGTGCAVFGETEAITRVSEGFSKEDILAGVHKSLANKVSSLVAKVGLQERCAVSGGGGLDVGLIKSLEENLRIQLLVPPQPQIVTALGAAIIAQEKNGK